MKNIPSDISYQIEKQFPTLFKQEGDVLISFIEAYYEFLENNEDYSVNLNRKMFSVDDIDTTLDEFVKHFKSKYLDGIRYNIKTSDAFTIKHIMDLYRSKGTPRAVKLLFKLVFDEDVEVYLPAKDIIKPSSSKWKIPTYLELTESDLLPDLIGKTITGSISGTTAFLESYVTRSINGKRIVIAYFTGSNGTFVKGELISSATDFTNAPKILGSLTGLENVISATGGFSKGDLVDIASVDGKNGIARISSIVDTTDSLSFTLNDGGFGYTLDSTTELLISNTIINVDTPNYSLESTVYQDLQTVSSNVALEANVGLSIYGTNSTSNVATGVIMAESGDDLVIQIDTGDFNNADDIVISGNTFTVSNVVNSMAIGYLIGQNTSSIGVIANTGIFYSGDNNGKLQSNGYPFNIITRVVSSGSGADFSVSELNYSETISIFSETVGSNNTFGETYLSLETGANAYGFPAYSNADANSTLGESLASSNLTIGEIASISSINPGEDYIFDQFVIIKNSILRSYDHYDYDLSFTSTGDFGVGETIIDEANTIVGKIKSFDTDDQTAVLRRLSFQNEVNVGNTYTGSVSTSEMTITSVEENYEDREMGNNADFVTQVQSLSGIPESIEIVDSGFGYISGKLVTGTSRSNNELIITGNTIAENQGTGQGYWETRDSHLNSEKKIRDNDFYQEFSYQLISNRSIDKYRDIVNEILHVSGTKLFGKVNNRANFEVENSIGVTMESANN